MGSQITRICYEKIPLYEISLPLQSNILVVPVFTSRPIFEKFRNIHIYSDLTAGEIVVSHAYSIPVHIPEAGCTISLDISSEGLAQEFVELAHELKRDQRIVIARLYNYDPQANRAVTWGNFTAHEVEENVYRTHMANVLNGLMFSPSVSAGKALWSPLRWLSLESSREYRSMPFFFVIG